MSTTTATNIASYHHEVFSHGAIFKWVLMAFIAGNINVGGFMGCERFVSHVTGFATLFGVSGAQGDWLGALSMLSVPTFFLIGAMVSGLLTEVRIAKGQKPRFDMVMGMVSCLLAIAGLMGHLEMFGAFGGRYKLEKDYLFLVLLCGACGLQNAAVTTSSRSLMRSTHLTGMTTDLGIGVARSLFGPSGQKMRATELYRTWVRLMIIVGFGSGGLVGAILFLKVDYLGFLLPASLAVLSAIFANRLFIFRTT